HVQDVIALNFSIEVCWEAEHHPGGKRTVDTKPTRSDGLSQTIVPAKNLISERFFDFRLRTTRQERHPECEVGVSRRNGCGKSSTRKSTARRMRQDVEDTCGWRIPKLGRFRAVFVGTDFSLTGI